MHRFRPLFGDDVFISYKRAEAASRYALALASELTRRKLACYLDQYGTQPGKDLPPSLKRRIRRSALFALVGSAEAASSESIRLEIEEFLPTGRPIIPITFRDFETGEGTLAEAAWYPLIQGIALATETSEAFAAGKASPQVIDRIVETEGFTSRNRRLWRMAVSIVVGTSLLLLAGMSYARKQVTVAESKIADATDLRNTSLRDWRNAVIAQQAADQRTHTANLRTRTANQQAQSAMREAQELRLKAQRAKSDLDCFLAQQRLAEHGGDSNWRQEFQDTWKERLIELEASVARFCRN